MIEKGEIQPDMAFIASMNVIQLETAMIGLIPVVKIDTGKYLIGSKLTSLQIKSESQLVHVGGGYTSLEDYITKVARFECLKINKHMKKHNKDYENAVCGFLDKHKAHVKIKSGFLSSQNQSGEIFSTTMKVLEKKQDMAEKRLAQLKVVKTHSNNLKK